MKIEWELIMKKIKIDRLIDLKGHSSNTKAKKAKSRLKQKKTYLQKDVLTKVKNFPS